MRLKFLFLGFILLFGKGDLWAEESGFKFEVLKQLDATSVKNQCQTNTCWAFSTGSFIESELIRMGKGRHDLSEMFVVRMVYPEKIRRYVRYHGKTRFAPGSVAGDVSGHLPCSRTRTGGHSGSSPSKRHLRR